MATGAAQLYEAYETLEGLTSVADAAPHAAHFTAVLEAASQGDKSLALVSDWIGKFFSLFPASADKALGIVLDMCEHSQLSIRLRGINALAKIGTSTPTYVEKVADVLTQLLLVDNASERSAVERSFSALLASQHKQQTVAALLANLASEEQELGKRAAQFYKQVTRSNAFKAALKDDEPFQAWFIEQNLSLLESGQSAVPSGFVLESIRSQPLFKKDATLQASLTQILTVLPQQFQPADGCAKFVRNLRQVAKLTKDAADLDAFATFFFTQIVPARQQTSDFRTAINAASEFCRQFSAAVVREHFPALVHLFNEIVSADGDTAPDFFIAERLLVVIHFFASQSPRQMLSLCGIFVPSGQPAEFASETAERRADFTARLNQLAKHAKTHRTQLNKAAAAKKTKGEKNNINALTTALLSNPPKFVSSFQPKKAQSNNKKQQQQQPAKAKTNNNSTNKRKAAPKKKAQQQQPKSQKKQKGQPKQAQSKNKAKAPPRDKTGGVKHYLPPTQRPGAKKKAKNQQSNGTKKKNQQSNGNGTKKKNQQSNGNGTNKKNQQSNGGGTKKKNQQNQKSRKKQPQQQANGKGKGRGRRK